MDDFNGSQVDGTQYHLILLAGFHVHLQRGLSVQFDGQVHHVSTFHQTVGRGVCPSACQVDTYRASSPDNLVGIDRHAGMLAFVDGSGQSFTHQTECQIFLFLAVLSFQSQGT